MSNSNGRPKARAGWRLMKRGTLQKNVRALLGEPASVVSGEFFETWFYGNGAYVRFDKPAMIGRWRVHEWAEPN